MEIKLYAKASLSMLNVACKEMFPNPKIITNLLIHTSKATISSTIVMDSHRFKTVYYINKLDLKEIKPFF